MDAKCKDWLSSGRREAGLKVQIPSASTTAHVPVFSSGQIEALHSFFAPPSDQSEVLLRNRGVLLARETCTGLRMAFIVVVARRALSLEALMKHRPAPDFRDPFGLGRGAGFDRTGFVLFRILDDIGDVMRLLIECLREVRGDR